MSGSSDTTSGRDKWPKAKDIPVIPGQLDVFEVIDSIQKENEPSLREKLVKEAAAQRLRLKGENK